MHGPLRSLRGRRDNRFADSQRDKDSDSTRVVCTATQAFYYEKRSLQLKTAPLTYTRLSQSAASSLQANPTTIAPTPDPTTRARKRNPLAHHQQQTLPRTLPKKRNKKNKTTKHIPVCPKRRKKTMASVDPQDTNFADDEETLTPLEQEVLDEYARLLENLNTVRLFPPSPTTTFPLSSFQSIHTIANPSNETYRCPLSSSPSPTTPAP